MFGSLYRIQIILMNCILIWSCDPGYVEFIGKCESCSNNCLSCSLPSMCDTCLPKFYRYTETINLVFSSVTVSKCGACKNGCEICSNSSDCSFCLPKFYQTGQNCYACPNQCATYHHFIFGTTCSACDTSCKTCSGSSSTCTSCDIGKYLSSSQCLPCSFPCSACINNSNDCTDCINIDKIAVNFQCVCEDGYYSDGSNQCQLCTAPCLKCENNPNNCTECISTFTLSQDINYKCQCEFGYFSVDPQTCQKCQSPCQTCESNQNHCLSCVDIHQIITDLHQCICNTGWIFNTNGITCIKCQLSCDSCIDTINKCVTCKDQIHQQPESCQCESGWIFDDNYFCIPCLEPCKTCEISTSKCLTCTNVHQELNNISQCVCQSTYYSQDLTTCIKCESPCFECDINGCINCIDFNQILDSNQKCICKSGYLQQNFICLQCQNPCATCINYVNKCLTCVDPNQIVQDNKCFCKEGFEQKGDFCCDKQCIDCQGIDNCNNCVEGFYLSMIKQCLQCIDHCDICQNQINCQACQQGYFINQSTQCEQCVPFCKICGNSLNCDICFNGYYLTDQKCEICNQNCLTCVEFSEKCISCRSNYEINSNNQCMCKIGYYEEYNQCYRCEYPCKTCLSKTVCQECVPLSNLHLDKNFQCNCSPGYFWNQNSCSQCYQLCLTCIGNQFHCLSCEQRLNRILNNTKCMCTDNYFESDDGVCISCLDQLGKSQVSCKYQDCKDQIWTYGEECDDGNDVNRDGCSNCKIDQNYSCSNKILKQSICFQCSTNCIQCQLNIQTNKPFCIKCQVGYFLDKNDCVECSINCLECIDQAYNCISCKFSQQKNHKCQVCESGYYADEINGTCLSKCGDQIKIKEEECDDGNLVKGDGCDDQCRLENKYIFLKGVSIIPNFPKPLLQSIGTSQIYSSIRLFKLSYTNHIVITDGFQIKDYISLHISNKHGILQIDQFFQLTQDTFQINEFNQSELNLVINITFSRSSQDEILLIKFLNTSIIYSIEGYSQVVTEVSCLIPKVTHIDNVIIAQVQLTTKSNSYILYFIGAMCGGSVLFGGVEVFFNLLDSLQVLSYLKYLNTQFPYNLQTYFQLFEFAQFNFIQKIFDFSGLIDQILHANNLKQLPTKVANDGIPSLFIINSATITTVWISLFGIYLVAKVIPKILYQIKCKFYSENQTQNSLLVQIGVYYLTLKYFINRLCFNIISEFFWSGILRAHMTTAYDFTFSLALQFYTLELNSPNIFIRLSSLIACVASVIYIFSLYFVIKLSQMKKYALNNKVIQTKYGSIFNGIKINRFSKYLNTILLIKKLIFMLLLIFAYQFPIFQIVSITLLSIFMSLFYFLFNPLEDKLEYFKQLFSEVSVSFTLITITILACDLELAFFQYEIRQNFGWACIFFMTSMLCIQLGIDGFQQWRYLFKKYKLIKKLAQSIIGVFKRKKQVTAPSNIFQ